MSRARRGLIKTSFRKVDVSQAEINTRVSRAFAFIFEEVLKDMKVQGNTLLKANTAKIEEE